MAPTIPDYLAFTASIPTVFPILTAATSVRTTPIAPSSTAPSALTTMARTASTPTGRSKRLQHRRRKRNQHTRRLRLQHRWFLPFQNPQIATDCSNTDDCYITNNRRLLFQHRQKFEQQGTKDFCNTNHYCTPMPGLTSMTVPRRLLQHR